MTPEEFFDQFELVTAAPGGVERLRKLILRLAVRGRLGTGDEHDSSAFDLVRKCLATKGQRPKTMDLVFAETPFAIPDTWQWARFDQLVDFQAGRTPSTKESRYWEGGIPWVSIGDMPDAGEVKGTKRTVSQLAVDKVFRQAPVPVGSLLMSFKLSIGKLAFTTVPCFHNEAIIAIKPPLDELKVWLHVALRGIDLTIDTANAVKGQTLNRKRLSALLVPVPPLEEQARIVAKVDQLMALCDELKMQLRDYVEMADRLCESLVANAVQAAESPSLVAS